MKIRSLSLGILLLALSQAGCAPEIGSDKWCEAMKEKPKGEWSTNEATAYGKHCVLGMQNEEE